MNIGTFMNIFKKGVRIRELPDFIVYPSNFAVMKLAMKCCPLQTSSLFVKKIAKFSDIPFSPERLIGIFFTQN